MIYTIKDDDTIHASGRDLSPFAEKPRTAKPPTGLVPMRAGTSHVVRLGGMSGSFKVGPGLSVPPRAMAVCAHVDCAGKTWPDASYIEASHRGVPRSDKSIDQHAWGWFHDGELYAPTSESATPDPSCGVCGVKASACKQPLVSDGSGYRCQACAVVLPDFGADLYRKQAQQVEKEIAQAVLGPFPPPCPHCGAVFAWGKYEHRFGCAALPEKNRVWDHGTIGGVPCPKGGIASGHTYANSIERRSAPCGHPDHRVRACVRLAGHSTTEPHDGSGGGPYVTVDDVRKMAEQDACAHGKAPEKVWPISPAVKHVAAIVREKLTADAITILEERGSALPSFTFRVETWGTMWGNRADVAAYFDKLDVWLRADKTRPNLVTWNIPDHGAWADVSFRVAPDPHEERRKREAPLVALVANVPEGLDANGWRAGVAALGENTGVGRMLPDGVGAFFMMSGNRIEKHIRSGTTPASNEPTGVHVVVSAYRRAIAPHGPRPKPERRGATWRERGPRLVVDNGED